MILTLIGCKSKQTSSYTTNSVKDSIVKTTEINYVQESLEYTSEFDISQIKPFKQSFTNRGVTTTIKKDSLSNKLLITNKVENDTLLRLKDSQNYFNQIKVTEKKDELIRYTPNRFNWIVPLVLGGVIVVLILGYKFDLLGIVKGLF